MWCPLPRTFSKRASAVTRDDLHTRMSLQPGSQGGGAGVGKQFKRTIGAEVDQDGFVVLAFAIRIELSRHVTEPARLQNRA